LDGRGDGASGDDVFSGSASSGWDTAPAAAPNLDDDIPF